MKRARKQPKGPGPSSVPSPTPLTDALLTDAEPGAIPFVGSVTWADGFVMGHGRVIIQGIPGLRLFHHNPAITLHGKRVEWCVQEVEFAEDKQTVLRVHRYWPADSEALAQAAFEHLSKIFRERLEKLRAASAPHRPTSDEQDLAAARQKVLREQFPDTFTAMDGLAKMPMEARAGAIENVLRAYAVDLFRLQKPASLGDVSMFNTLPDDTSFILELAKAYKAKSPHDPIDEEIARNWFAAGYDRMSLAEYTQAINARCGTNLKPEAMDKRRYAKLGLMTKRPPGPAPRK